MSLSIPKFERSVPGMLANLRIGTLAAVLGIAVLAGGALLLMRAVPEQKFVEYRMGEPQDAPIAIAAGTDGSIWFTIDHADAIGRLRNGHIERLATSSRNIERSGSRSQRGSAWFTDPPRARTSVPSAIARFALDARSLASGWRRPMAPPGSPTRPAMA